MAAATMATAAAVLPANAGGSVVASATTHSPRARCALTPVECTAHDRLGDRQDAERSVGQQRAAVAPGVIHAWWSDLSRRQFSAPTTSIIVAAGRPFGIPLRSDPTIPPERDAVRPS